MSGPHIPGNPWCAVGWQLTWVESTGGEHQVAARPQKLYRGVENASLICRTLRVHPTRAEQLGWRRGLGQRLGRVKKVTQETMIMAIVTPGLKVHEA